MKPAAAALLALVLSACAHAPAPKPTPLDAAAALMAGHFDSSAQAAADPDYLSIRLVMVPIWPGRDDARWFYVEQATAGAPGKPYRQRVYRLSDAGGGELASEVFLVERPERFVRGWETGALAGLTEAELEARPGCTVYLTPEGDGFRGGTRGHHCVSNLRGAAWATAEVELGPDGLRSWDRGFDAAGVQVWGAVRGPYAFRRAD